MVFYIPESFTASCFTAYLFVTLSEEQLKRFKSEFELGACSRFNPLLELKIVHAPEDYKGKSHQYMRAKENEAGRTDPFIVIDENFIERDAVWLIDDFADEDQVEDGEAESTDVVMKVLLKTECLALSWINYVDNSPMDEDLGACGIQRPFKNDFEQLEPADCGGLDMKEQQWDYDVEFIAEPGEFEVTTDKRNLSTYAQPGERGTRLKDDVAQAAGLVNRWLPYQDAEPVELPDGTMKTFPAGSVRMQLHYNPEGPWPEYRWPEGSL